MRPALLLALPIVLLAMRPSGALADELAALKKENEQLAADLKQAQARIKLLEKQIERLTAAADKPGDSKEQAADPFAVGSLFKGSRFYQQPGAMPLDGQVWTLKVTKRNKAQFWGEIRFNSVDGLPQRLDVSGIAPPIGKGKVEFRTAGKPVFNQQFAGEMNDGKHIVLKFKGTGNTGGAVFGTGNLELK